MSVLGSIMSAIFGTKAVAADNPPMGGTPAGSTPAGSTPAGSMPVVDVEAVMNKLASASKEKLDWKVSIVDLMKLLGLDSSLSARKQLAKDLNYTGDTNNSAAMNIWLHKQVMQKLAANGGKVPADLLKH